MRKSMKKTYGKNMSIFKKKMKIQGEKNSKSRYFGTVVSNSDSAMNSIVLYDSMHRRRRYASCYMHTTYCYYSTLNCTLNFFCGVAAHLQKK